VTGHDTASITYRCFLPDLTRFVTVCCVGTSRMIQATGCHPALKNRSVSAAARPTISGRWEPWSAQHTHLSVFFKWKMRAHGVCAKPRLTRGRIRR